MSSLNITIPTAEVELTPRAIEEFLKETISLGILDGRTIAQMSVRLEQHAARTYRNRSGTRKGNQKQNGKPGKGTKKQGKTKNGPSADSGSGAKDSDLWQQKLVRRWKTFLRKNFIEKEEVCVNLRGDPEASDDIYRHPLFNRKPWNYVKTMKDLKWVLMLQAPHLQPSGTTWKQLLARDYVMGLSKIGQTLESVEQLSREPRKSSDGQTTLRSLQAETRLKAFEVAFKERGGPVSDPVLKGKEKGHVDEWKKLYPLGVDHPKGGPDAPKLKELQKELLEKESAKGAEIKPDMVQPERPTEHALQAISEEKARMQGSAAAETNQAGAATHQLGGGEFTWNILRPLDQIMGDVKHRAELLTNDSLDEMFVFEHIDDPKLTEVAEYAIKCVNYEQSEEECKEPKDVTDLIIASFHLYFGQTETLTELLEVRRQEIDATHEGGFNAADIKACAFHHIWDACVDLLIMVMKTPGLKVGHLANVQTCIKAYVARESPKEGDELSITVQTYLTDMFPAHANLIDRTVNLLDSQEKARLKASEEFSIHFVPEESGSQGNRRIRPVITTRKRIKRKSRTETRKKASSNTTSE